MYFMSMSAIEWSAAGAAIIVGIGVMYAMLEMRRTYARHREKLAHAVAVIEKFQARQGEFLSLLEHVESDGRALQKIALQVEGTVASLKDTVGVSLNASAERLTMAIENLRDHMDTQEERLALIVEGISEHFPQPHPQQPQQPQQPQDPPVLPATNDRARLRRQALGRDSGLRFALLKEWMSINGIAVLHRASRGWNTAGDLIGNVPDYLEPEAEILNNCILLIGTREHEDRLAIPLRELDASSDFSQWFGPASEGNGLSHLPAVLKRSNGHFNLVAKGTNPLAVV